MTTHAPAQPHRTWSAWHPLWLGQVRHWQRRLPAGFQLGSPQQILGQVEGALWLACKGTLPTSRSQAWRALRQVLYQEFERPWRHFHPLPQTLAGPSPAPLDLPPAILPFAEAYLQGQGPEGCLRRACRFWHSRRKARLLNRQILQALYGYNPDFEVHKRAARLAAAVARDGARYSHRQEARHLRCMLRMLEPTPPMQPIHQMLSGILAVQREANRAENPECASVRKAPHAMALKTRA